MRYLAAALTLAVGAVHLQQYVELLRFVPTIGPLFLLNAIAAVLVAAMLMTRFRVVGALAGIGLSIGSLVALGIARYGQLFGYSEPTLRSPVAIALVVEAAAVVALVAYLLRRRAVSSR